MKNKIAIILSLCLAFCVTGKVNAQSGLVTTGADIGGPGGSASFSVGQVDYITIRDSGGAATGGIQQPYEIFIVTGIEEARISLRFGVSVYPNPATEYVILSLENYKAERLSYEIYDAQGKLLLIKESVANGGVISLAEFSNAVYFIKIIDNGNPVKTFKIIKNL